MTGQSREQAELDDLREKLNRMVSRRFAVGLDPVETREYIDLTTREVVLLETLKQPSVDS